MWRARKWRIVNLLDDFLLVADTEEELIGIRDLAITDLTRLGFCINWDKAVLLPSQVIKFLGFHLAP